MPFQELKLLDDPVLQFERWFDDARRSGLGMPEAVCLATVGEDGRPSARMVLFKGMFEGGLTFFTNYGSRKALELEANPHAALVFHWKELERQARVEGRVSRLPAEQSDAYFATRGRGSRLSAWASRQSQRCGSRAELDAQYREVERRFDGRDVPRPEFWGGFRVEPEYIEFWVGLPDRLHDRWAFRRDGDGWLRERLQP